MSSRTKSVGIRTRTVGVKQEWSRKKKKCIGNCRDWERITCSLMMPLRCCEHMIQLDYIILLMWRRRLIGLCSKALSRPCSVPMAKL